MVRISWNEAGSRRFQAGLDRGVFYRHSGPERIGHPWSGLVSATRTRAGGEVTPNYVDAFKFDNAISLVEHSGQISALDFPNQAGAALNGSLHVGGGLTLSNQTVEEFSLSYRVRMGDDVRGPNAGYKIHLIYNALAVPADVVHNTLNDTPEPEQLSWSYTARAIMVEGRLPVAHLTVDSTRSTSENLSQLEDLLYGTPTTNARMPTPQEVIAIFA